MIFLLKQFVISGSLKLVDNYLTKFDEKTNLARESLEIGAQMSGHLSRSIINETQTRKTKPCKQSFIMEHLVVARATVIRCGLIFGCPGDSQQVATFASI